MLIYSKFIAKLLSLFMSLVLTLNGLSFGSTDSKEAALDYIFSNAIAGSAAGTVTVSAAKDGEYDLYWGNSEDKKLTFDVGGYDVTYSEFVTVNVENSTGSEEIQSFTTIPEGAESVLIYKGNRIMGSKDLPEEKLADNGEVLYRFGALSDLHYNRYFNTLSDDSLITFPNALNFFEKCGVELVGMSGDLSSEGEENALKKFNRAVSDYDFPVYTCTGNHDVHKKSDIEKWQQYINTGVYSENKREGVADVAPNNMDFVYAPAAANGDVFIFLCQYAWDYRSDTSRILTDEQLDWLGAELEKHKDKTVYLFFHTFLQNCEEGADRYMGEGNLINEGGVYYDLVFTPGTPDEVRFRNYMKEYKNVVFFNGHSHWSYEMQKFNKNLNIADYNGEYATMVHISSVSSPRMIKSDTATSKKEMNMRRSEGTLVTVYADRIVLNAVDFLGGEILAYASYNIDLK